MIAGSCSNRTASPASAPKDRLHHLPLGQRRSGPLTEKVITAAVQIRTISKAPDFQTGTLSFITIYTNHFYAPAASTHCHPQSSRKQETQCQQLPSSPSPYPTRLLIEQIRRSHQLEIKPPQLCRKEHILRNANADLGPWTRQLPIRTQWGQCHYNPFCTRMERETQKTEGASSEDFVAAIRTA